MSVAMDISRHSTKEDGSISHGAGLREYGREDRSIMKSEQEAEGVMFSSVCRPRHMVSTKVWRICKEM